MCSITTQLSCCTGCGQQCSLQLFRKYVSRNAFSKGRAVLEWVGLDPEVVNHCYGSPTLDEEAAIQKGMLKWRETHGNVPLIVASPILEAMKFADIVQQHCSELVEELHQRMQGEVTFPVKHSCAQS